MDHTRHQERIIRVGLYRQPDTSPPGSQTLVNHRMKNPVCSPFEGGRSGRSSLSYTRYNAIPYGALDSIGFRRAFKRLTQAVISLLCCKLHEPCFELLHDVPRGRAVPIEPAPDLGPRFAGQNPS